METASHYGNRNQREQNEPVFQKNDGSWWFYDETWTHTYGPYETEDEARKKLNYYMRVELG